MVEVAVRNKKLEILISVATFFFIAHTIDHIMRDMKWPLTAEAIPFLAITALILATVFAALVLYRRGQFGPRFWAIFGAVTVATGWLGHFSPFTEQPPQYIFDAYRSPLAGGLAVGGLLALMLSLMATTIYAGILWARGSWRGHQASE